MSDVRRGEIFYIERSGSQVGSEQRDGRPAVIVSNDRNNANSGVVEVVYLTTQPKRDLPTHIEIRSTSKLSTALCEQIASVSVDRIGDYVGACTDREMEAIDVALAISLGIDYTCKQKTEVVETVKEVEVKVEDPELKSAIVKAEAERDVYKELYLNLLKEVHR